MTVISPPAYQQGGSYAARTDRLSVITGLLGYPGTSADEGSLRTRGGVRPSYQFQQLQVAAQGTPNMTVQVSAGIAYVQNKDLANYGAYTFVNDGTVNLTIAASSGTQYRKDTIVVQVLDAETLGTVNSASLVVVQGPYAASAGATTRGTIPPNSVVLADIAVNAGVTSITAGAITDGRLYQVASGGVLPVLSTGVPDHPAPGQMMYLTDTSVLRYGTAAGSTRQVMTEEQITPGAWNTYAPTWTTSGTAPAIGNGSLSGRYAQVGKTTTLLISLLAGSTTTFGSGEWGFSLPAAPAAIGTAVKFWTGTALGINPSTSYWPGLAQIEAGSTVVRAVSPMNANGSATSRWAATAPQTWANGHQLNISITYEAA
jgi:hypothetical protein